ncbi:MAG: phosphate ABC transporter permease subunit PstC [Planctomycetia bacterium]|nr:phosphate ABC transporter permease subunit PstC [Planctomycetia bacterium]
MQDKFFRTICFLCALMVPILLAGILICLIFNSAEAWRSFGWRFLISSEWNPAANQYGALPAILGTILTTGIAIVIAVPLSFITAFFITDLPFRYRGPLSCALDLLAAIPSVIYGMWGLFVLIPLMQKYVQPFLVHTMGLGRLPFVNENYNGFGHFTAGLVLALMILPYLSAIMRDVFQATPPLLKESAVGIGCTRWETARDIVLKYGIHGLIGGVFIGLGRALGETMAVLFIIGNVVRIPSGIFDSGTTIAATLANNFAEADGMMKSVLFALGLVLLGLSLCIQIIAHVYMNQTRKKRGELL